MTPPCNPAGRGRPSRVSSSSLPRSICPAACPPVPSPHAGSPCRKPGVSPNSLQEPGIWGSRWCGGAHSHTRTRSRAHANTWGSVLSCVHTHSHADKLTLGHASIVRMCTCSDILTCVHAHARARSPHSHVRVSTHELAACTLTPVYVMCVHTHTSSQLTLSYMCVQTCSAACTRTPSRVRTHTHTCLCSRSCVQMQTCSAACTLTHLCVWLHTQAARHKPTGRGCISVPRACLRGHDPVSALGDGVAAGLCLLCPPAGRR